MPRGVVGARSEALADELYDVVDDYSQAENVAAAHPEVVEHFRGALASYLQTIAAPDEQLDRLGLRSYA